MTKKLKNPKIGLLALKYIPVLMAFIMYINIICAHKNIKLKYVEPIAGNALLPTALVLTMSNTFQFCHLHKSCTWYSLITEVTLYNSNFLIKNDLYQILETIAIYSGTVLFLLLIGKVTLKQFYFYVLKE